MTPKEYTIKRFETNYPKLVELIDIWAEHSIEQNWDALCVLLNQHTVPDCPENVYSTKLQGNKRHIFFMELGDKIADYLMALGYKMTSKSTCDTQIMTPDGKLMIGYVIKAYTKIIKL